MIFLVYALQKLFADDTQIYFYYASQSERILLQNNLNIFSQWANKCQLNM